MDNGSKNFSVGYGNGLGDPPARAVTGPATRPTSVSGLQPVADSAGSTAGSVLVVDPTLSTPSPMPPEPDRPGRSRRGLLLTAVVAALLLAFVATTALVATQRSGTAIELGATDSPGGSTPGDPDRATGGADALNGGVITLEGGPESSRGTIVLEDGSVMIVLDDGSLIADPATSDPTEPRPSSSTTSITGATPPATDGAGRTVPTTNNPGQLGGPTTPSTPTTSGPPVTAGAGPTVTTPATTVTVAPVTAPPVTAPPVTPAPTTPATPAPTLGPPPQSIPNTLVLPPLKLLPSIVSFTGPQNASCPLFYKGSVKVILSWTTKFATSVTVSDGNGAVSLNANGSATLSFNCLVNSHTFTLRAVNSAGTSAPQSLLINRS